MMTYAELEVGREYAFTLTNFLVSRRGILDYEFLC